MNRILRLRIRRIYKAEKRDSGFGLSSKGIYEAGHPRGILWELCSRDQNMTLIFNCTHKSQSQAGPIIPEIWMHIPRERSLEIVVTPNRTWLRHWHYHPGICHSPRIVVTAFPGERGACLQEAIGAQGTQPSQRRGQCTRPACCEFGRIL